MYAWLFFDADGTLFDYNAAESGALAAALAEEGIASSPEILQAYRAINGALWRRLERGEISQETIRTVRFSQLSVRFELGLDPIDFGMKYLAHLAERADLIEGAERLLRVLRGRIGLLLLTNGIPEVQRSRLARSPLRGLFDHVVISGDVGAAKPDRRIFDVAMRSAGIASPSGVLMVGDSLSSDIEGAVRYGIDSCWFNPAGVPNPTELRPTFEIAALRELPAVLNRADDQSVLHLA